MKKLFIFLAIVKYLFLPLFVSGQVQVYGRYTLDGTIEPDVNVFISKPFSDSSKFSFTSFTLVEQNWAEALVGLSYSPKSWLNIGLSAGIEHNPALYRFAGSVWLGKDRSSLLFLWEKGDGNDNYWYKTTALYDISTKVSLGAIAWRFHGIGPVAIYNVRKLDSKFWVMPAHDFEFNENRVMFGVDIGI
ncbi:hypothetical protein IPF86_04305 [Candidatus Nomurabacteria bacterium]|jgi:hypothetical protein|nr:MAG: hypothetical protein IPF86_04305 [Candidatus Nomurabacteria bacterium]